jgi:type I restriction enzyme R subunit
LTQFAFLSADFPEILAHAQKAEKLALSDPRGACFWARLTLETSLKWLYRNEPLLKIPYQRELAALIVEPSLTELTGPAIVKKAMFIKNHGNRAVHDELRPPSPNDAAVTVRELFHLCFWIARTYAKSGRPDPKLTFDMGKLEKALTISASTVAQIQQIEGEFKAALKRAETAEAARRTTEDGLKAVEAELATLHAEYAALRKANAAVPDDHDYSEAATRDSFIDQLLTEAGWALDQTRDREFPVTGMPNQSGNGFVDYVLWGGDGKPLAVVEAKRSKKDSRTGQQQAKLYADCLERVYGRRPVIFTTNGYDHWIWDDVAYPPRKISGFLKKDELQLLHQRRANVRPLAKVDLDPDIAGRYYQQRAIRRVGEAFESTCNAKPFWSWRPVAAKPALSSL